MSSVRRYHSQSHTHKHSHTHTHTHVLTNLYVCVSNNINNLLQVIFTQPGFWFTDEDTVTLPRATFILHESECVKPLPSPLPPSFNLLHSYPTTHRFSSLFPSSSNLPCCFLFRSLPDYFLFRDKTLLNCFSSLLLYLAARFIHLSLLAKQWLAAAFQLLQGAEWLAGLLHVNV